MSLVGSTLRVQGDARVESKAIPTTNSNRLNAVVSSIFLGALIIPTISSVPTALATIGASVALGIGIVGVCKVAKYCRSTRPIVGAEQLNPLLRVRRERVQDTTSSSEGGVELLPVSPSNVARPMSDKSMQKLLAELLRDDDDDKEYFQSERFPPLQGPDRSAVELRAPSLDLSSEDEREAKKFAALLREPFQGEIADSSEDDRQEEELTQLQLEIAEILGEENKQESPYRPPSPVPFKYQVTDDSDTE